MVTNAPGEGLHAERMFGATTMAFVIAGIVLRLYQYAANRSPSSMRPRSP
ncbi:MAG: hypothetical protein ACREL7_03975 [Longimicrobiales bacterium]